MMVSFELTLSKLAGFICLAFSAWAMSVNEYTTATEFAFYSAILFGTKNLSRNLSK